MTKSKLIICLFVLLLFLSYSISYATSDIDMNILSNSINNTNTNNNNTNTSNTVDTDDEVFEDEDDTYTPPASVSSTTYSDGTDELQIGDIINICLIVVGVLLILLSIAILIRLKG